MSQSAARLIKRLQDHGSRFFTTADVMTLSGMKSSAAAQALRRLSAEGIVASLKRGLWVSRLFQDTDPFEAVPHLTSPWPGYVSLYSALSRHGLVDEVPQAIYAVSAGRTAKYRTLLGEYRIHHLPSRLIWGFSMEHKGPAAFPMADKEKAILDLTYLGLIPRSPLGLPYKRDGRWDLDFSKLAVYARRFRFPPLVAHLKARGLWRRIHHNSPCRSVH